MRSFRLALWITVIIAALFLIGLTFYVETPTSSESGIQPGLIAGFNKGTHFILTDETGQPYNSAEKLGENDYALIFFGFTYCPAICPTELHKMATILDLLGDLENSTIHPLFISIDPERDTSEVLKNYVTLFHPEIKGLTGTTDRIRNILDAWHVYAARVDDPSMSEYTMDHSTYTYLVDHDMAILDVFRMNDPVEDIIRHIEKIIKGSMSAS